MDFYRKDALNAIREGATAADLQADERYKDFLKSESFLIEAVHQNPMFIEGLHEPSEDVMVAAVEADDTGKVFRQCTCVLWRQTEKVCLAAVRECPKNLSYVARQTPEICMAAIEGWPENEYSGFAITDVKKEFRTPELILKAVTKTEVAINFVPGDELNDEICMAAIQHFPDDVLNIRDYPVTVEMYSAALHRQEELLQKRITDAKAEGRELTDAERDGPATIMSCFSADVFDRLKEADIVEMMKLDPLNLRFVPIDRMRSSVITAALRKSGMAIQYVPEPKLSQTMCESAVKQAPQAIKFIPRQFITQSLMKLILEDPSEMDMLADILAVEPGANLLELCKEMGMQLKN